jgi:hypothetical protein
MMKYPRKSWNILLKQLSFHETTTAFHKNYNMRSLPEKLSGLFFTQFNVERFNVWGINKIQLNESTWWK